MTGMDDMEWYCVFHGAAFDPEIRLAAKRAGVPMASALAVWLVLQDYASQAHDRGSVDCFKPEVVADALDMTIEAVIAIKDELAKLGVIDEANKLSAWLKRQPISTNRGGRSGLKLADSSQNSDFSKEEEIDREIDRNKTAKRSHADKGDGEPELFPDDSVAAVAAWNAIAGQLGLSAVQRLGGARKAALRARLRECGGIQGWATAMEKVKGSKFLRGEGKEGWKATFDFIVTASKFTRLMEGAYDNNSRAGNQDIDQRVRNVREGVAGSLGLGPLGSGRVVDEESF